MKTSIFGVKVKQGISVFLLGAALCHSAYAWNGPTDTKAWNQVRTQVKTKRNTLERLYSKAKKEGYDVERARVSLDTIDLFMRVTEWDFKNQDTLKEYAAKWPVGKFFKGNDYKKIPFNQMEDCLEIADFAINQLNQQRSKKIKLAKSFDMFSGHKIAKNGSYAINGRSVFPYSIVGGGLGDTKHSFGSKGSSYHYLSHLQSDMKPRYWRKKAAIDRVIRTADDYRTPFVQFHGHAGGLPDWMTDGPYGIKKTNASPPVYNGGRNFVNYDINNPHIRKWLKALNTEMASAIAETNMSVGGPPVIHMIANEPHFSVKEKGWRVKEGGFTSHMKNGFKTWLKKKYGSISKLNKAHKKNYKSFNDFKVSFPVKTSQRGTPEYYEHLSYNLDRVNSYFKEQTNTIKKQDPSAQINIKLLGGTLVSDAAGGIDFEYLTNLMDVTGSDFESTPDTAKFAGHSPDRIANDSWIANYSFYWSAGTQFTDYAKSLKPNAPHYNSEWHGFDTGAWRDFDMKRDYVNASLWTHHAHGLDFTEVWAWQRDKEGKIKEAGAIGGLTTMPVALDQYGRTMKEINAHGNAVAAIARQQRHAHVYFSRDSSIQSGSMNQNGQIVYESIKLLNHNVGVATKNTLSKLNPKKDFVVVPPTQYLSQSDANSLNKFKNAGGKVIVFQESGKPFGMKSALGFKRSREIFKPFKKLKYTGSPYSMAKALSPLTKSFEPKRKLPFKIYNKANQAKYGLLVKEAANSAGYVDLFLVNVSKNVLTADFGGSKNKWKLSDQINGGSVNHKISLRPMEIRLLRAKPSSGQVDQPPSDNGSVSGESIAVKHSGKCLNLEKGLSTNGAAIQQWDCRKNNANQEFTMRAKGGGYFEVRTKHNKCLGVASGSTANNAQVIQWKCNGSADQQFLKETKAGGWFRLKARHSNKCLDLENLSSENGAILKQYACHNGANQLFKPKTASSSSKVPSGWTSLKVRHSNKCVDLRGGSSANGTGFQQWNCGNSDGKRQDFKFVAKGGGYYEIKTRHNKCIGVGASAKENGSDVVQWTCKGVNDQQFKVKDKGNGWFELVARHSNKCLDVKGNRSNNGVGVHQWQCLGTNNQQFKFTD